MKYRISINIRMAGEQEKRVEILDIQALLEAERVSHTNPDKRGNSIFRSVILTANIGNLPIFNFMDISYSEVEDRRLQVERHLAKLTALLDKEKRKNQDLQTEIVKVKASLLFISVQILEFFLMGGLRRTKWLSWHAVEVTRNRAKTSTK